MSTAEQLWTVNTIKDANRAAGSHWFGPDTMRFFGTRVLSEVYQGHSGIYFVTSDKQYNGTRGYTVRQFNPADGSIGTVSEVGELTKRRAMTLAKTKAGGQESRTTSEAFRPVSVLQQFLDDLAHYGNKGNADIAAQLITLARRHHRMMERLCNGELPINADGEGRGVAKLRQHISIIARLVGATGVIYSGDPRGCTVKLTFADGATNDFGKEGYCVPTKTK